MPPRASMPYRRYILKDPQSQAVLATAPAARGESAYEAFSRAGRPLPTRCRGSSICGMCRVQLGAGAEAVPPAEPDELALLARVAPMDPHARLGCRVVMADDARCLELVLAGPSPTAPATP